MSVGDADRSGESDRGRPCHTSFHDWRSPMSDATAGAEPPTRATDADRDRVVERLQSALGAGALTFDEIEERLDAVYRARTQADLAPLVADLPVAAPPVESTPTDRSALAAAAASSWTPASARTMGS